MKIRFVIWDWKDPMDIEQLTESLQEVFDGKNLPCIREVDTKCDLGAVVISSTNITKQEAQKIYNRYDRLSDENHPTNKTLVLKS